MIALIFLVGIAVWLVVVILLTVWIPRILGPGWPRTIARLILFPVLLVLPIADEWIGRKQFRLSAKNAATGQYSAAADLKGWKDGDYGLTIGAPTQEPDRIAPILYPNSVAYLAMDGALAPMGVTFGGGTKSDSFTGSAYDDVITTGGGSGNYVNANGGDDLVVGGDGREFIRTGPNSASPTLKDNDIAFGGEGTDILLGGAGEDLILGDGHYTPFSKSIGLDYAEAITSQYKTCRVVRKYRIAMYSIAVHARQKSARGRFSKEQHRIKAAT